jgi:integrase
VEKLRLPSYTYIEGPFGRLLHTTPADTPELLAQLFDYLKHSGTQVPGALLDLLEKNVAPVSVVLPHGGSAERSVAQTADGGCKPSVSADPAEVLAPGTAASATVANQSLGVAGPSSGPLSSDGFTAHTGKQAAWLSDLIEEWHRHKVNTGTWKAPSTWTNAFEPDLRVFRELIADRTRIAAAGSEPKWDIRMGDIDEARIKSSVEATWRFPARPAKLARGADAKEILALADGQRNAAKARKKRVPAGSPSVSDVDDIDDSAPARQTAYNAKKKLARVKAFLAWAVRMKCLSADTLTPLELALEEGDKTDPEGGYRPFSKEELQLIFGSEEFAKDRFSHAWQYFAPLLALYSSGRVREVADLTVDDIVEVDGIPCIRFRSGNVVVAGPSGRNVVRKRVKSPGSERKIPISRALIELGFLDYVQRRRAEGHVWVWDSLNWEEKSGRGRYISRWFSQYLKGLGIKHGRHKAFHSFRSTLDEALTGLGLDSAIIGRVLGHTPSTVRGKHYTRHSTDPDVKYTMPIAAVRDALDRIDWGVTFHPSRKWGANPSA